MIYFPYVDEETVSADKATGKWVLTDGDNYVWFGSGKKDWWLAPSQQ